MSKDVGKLHVGQLLQILTIWNKNPNNLYQPMLLLIKTEIIQTEHTHTHWQT